MVIIPVLQCQCLLGSQMSSQVSHSLISTQVKWNRKKKKGKKKMAESARILVSVLENPITLSSRSLVFCMQGNSLQFDSAQWTAKQSNGGFSVTFFWPALKPEVEVKAVRNRRKLGTRKAKSQPLKGTQEEAAVANHIHSEEKQASTSHDAPITAHQPTGHSAAIKANHPKVAQPASIDLTTCESVAYEMRDSMPGVKYTVDGSESWTPVMKRR